MNIDVKKSSAFFATLAVAVMIGTGCGGSRIVVGDGGGSDGGNNGGCNSNCGGTDNDDDNDGYDDGDDCDDTRASVNPGADEVCDNNRDDDCDGDEDQTDADCGCTSNCGGSGGGNNTGARTFRIRAEGPSGTDRTCIYADVVRDCSDRAGLCDVNLAGNEYCSSGRTAEVDIAVPSGSDGVRASATFFDGSSEVYTCNNFSNPTEVGEFEATCDGDGVPSLITPVRHPGRSGCDYFFTDINSCEESADNVLEDDGFLDCR